MTSNTDTDLTSNHDRSESQIPDPSTITYPSNRPVDSEYECIGCEAAKKELRAQLREWLRRKATETYVSVRDRFARQ